MKIKIMLAAVSEDQILSYYRYILIDMLIEIYKTKV